VIVVARAGVTTTNPVSGERITWEQTSDQTGGTRTVLRMWVAPGGGVRQRHIHPRSSERFTVIKGTIVVELDGTEYVAHAGESIYGPAGIAHAWWNGGEVELEATVEVIPSGRFEEYLELGFRWAREGRLNSRGRLDLLRGAAFADAYREDIVYTSPPRTVQRLLVGPCAWLARRRLEDVPRRLRTAVRNEPAGGRGVVEHVNVADIAGARLPDSIDRALRRP
jgi:quercetin dioxygenase-like cupin family protein